MLVAGLVLAVMILPIVSAVAREVFVADAAKSSRKAALRSAPRAGRCCA